MYRLNARLLFLFGGLIAATASADTLYAVFGYARTNTYGTLDTVTGDFTPISSQGPQLFGMGFAPNGNLYGTDNVVPAGVYQIDPLTGALTNLGSSTDSVVGSTVGSDGLIYAASQASNADFFTIDPNTLATNIISSLGFTSNGLAVFANGFFYTDNLNTDTLERVDPITGIATVIGTGLGVQIISAVNANGTIYGGSFDGNLYTIDLSTGVATLDVAINGANGGLLNALAFTAVPEPSTFLLGGIALAALWVFKSRVSRARC